MPADQQKLDTKLAAARTRLILDKPFLGALVLRLPMQPARGDWCRTTATDARRFYYNPDYIAGLSLAQTQFMLAHEALHCALSHFARRQHRIKHRWDLACDFAINPLLVEDGLSPPPDCVVIDQYRGMTAEEIYPLLDENEQSETLDQHLYDQAEQHGGQPSGGRSDPSPEPSPVNEQQPAEPPPAADEDSPGEQQPDDERAGEQPASAQPGQTGEASNAPAGAASNAQEDGQQAEPPAPLTPDERDTLAVQWQQRLAGAAQQAQQAGKLGGTLARMIDHLLQPQLPWRMLLARYMTARARDDFSYQRPSRREGTAILPSLRSAQIDAVIAVDTSGSIRSEEINAFVAEIDALKAQMRARITLLACDAQLADEAPWVFEPWDELRFPEQICGGGGTDFRPVFDWLEEQDQRPELLVYFTDAEGEFPKLEPACPVVWLIKGRAPVPWGQRIQLN